MLGPPFFSDSNPRRTAFEDGANSLHSERRFCFPSLDFNSLTEQELK